ncbi:MAG: histone deacetylase [Deltaproteobacteria bacterium]|nr:histone deacetylase [Deltaproteobacteria bacterium]
MTNNNLAGIACDKRYLDHRISHQSLECPQRLHRIYTQLRHGKYDQGVKKIEPRLASDEEIFAVHSEFYIEQIESHSLDANPYSYDKDTYLMEDSLYVAKLAAGGCVVLAGAIMNDDIGRGFSLVRPPGHHAESGRGMGFCILNNVAITAEYLSRVYGLNRILILDFDVHHPNGTQEIFYETDRVMLVSFHQGNLFPFTGKPSETGKNVGSGYTVNVPVLPQYGDLEYSHLMGRVVQPIIEHYFPQIILVSMGFDGHIEDSVSDTCLTTEAYSSIANTMKYFANEFCHGRLLYVLEGGYNPRALGDSVFASLDTLINPNVNRPSFRYSTRAASLINDQLPDYIKGKWGIA